MDTLNDLNERVDAFVGTSSFDTPAATDDQAPIDVPAEVHEAVSYTHLTLPTKQTV